MSEQSQYCRQNILFPKPIVKTNYNFRIIQQSLLGDIMDKDKKAKIYHYSDFTENHYIKLLKIAKKNYKFITFNDYKKLDRTILWRHDIDDSPHRAYSLAKIEGSQNIKTTYFLTIHSNFYNTFENEIFKLIKNILKLGHSIGLHFDPTFYKENFGENCDYDEFVYFEKSLIEKMFNTEINAISIHNPTTLDEFDMKREYIDGMVNTYSDYIMKHYTYCSDSNCYWRFQRLYDVLLRATDERLHVLTHDSCWTPKPMSPRDRISRAIDGRAKKQHVTYDKFLKEHNRENIS